ncbi:CYTH domain-containing protein [Porphyromonas sp.]|uniref:CYTH domain-containing protein n=1 Tax=Porphyromonas sp. TaxID=1924944 RepID=UPI0026DD543A|nr:CYTH domain-containing protein [Porphyromonas sp.]MDO4771133.1 CYTH domain-containing protein [Porphyromonas sp.]
MGVEIERKYLIKPSATLPPPERILTIKQGYIRKNAGVSVRIRISNDKGYITIKGSKGSGRLSRLEYEYEIPLQDAEELLSMCSDGVISKNRYHIRHEGMLWEVDYFEGDNAGLVLAEVELPTESATVAIPDWIDEEITGREEYYNSYLSQHPFKTWDNK